MKTIDLNLSVLWANEDYKAENGRMYYTHEDALKLKFKDGWRLPTSDEYQEMFDALRKTEIKIDGKLAFRYRKNKNENEIIFLANGWQDHKGIRMICEDTSAPRITSDFWGSTCFYEAELHDKHLAWNYTDGARSTIRLVKNNPNFKGKKPHYIIFPH